MPRIRDCVICGKRFTSYHGINVCSEQCKIEKKKRQDENSWHFSFLSNQSFLYLSIIGLKNLSSASFLAFSASSIFLNLPRL